jgi:hypothetical protein
MTFLMYEPPYNPVQSSLPSKMRADVNENYHDKVIIANEATIDKVGNVHIKEKGLR